VSRKWKLSQKLIGAFLLVGLLPFCTLAAISLYSSSRALSEQAFQQLIAVREIKKGQLQAYLVDLKAQLTVFSQDPLCKTALVQFDKTYEAAGNSVSSPAWEKLAKRMINA